MVEKIISITKSITIKTRFNKRNLKIRSFPQTFSLLLMMMVLGLSGCGRTEKRAETVSMYDLRLEMEAASDALPEMSVAGDTDADAESSFEHISDMDYVKVEHYFLSYSAEGKADEIVVIAVKDLADTKEAKKSLEEHVESRKKLFDQYEPTESARLEKAELFTEKQYVVLIISDDNNKIKEAFNKYIEESAQN